MSQQEFAARVAEISKLKIVNLTPHPLVIQRTCPRCNGQTCEDSRGECQQGSVTEAIESTGVARCATVETTEGFINGIPVVKTEFGAVDGLPEVGWECQGKFVRFDPAKPDWEPCPECGMRSTDGKPDHMFFAYVVSSITAQAVSHRNDVYVPARPIRNDKGQIIACTALGRIS